MTPVSEQSVTDHRTAAVIKLLAGSSAQPRVAMRGSSMAPLLKAPMVLELGPCTGPDRVGDIVVFERNGQLIAHRITGVHQGQLQTCGDAVPWSPEYPERDAIIGRVVAVKADDAPSAVRVDGWLFNARGTYKARLRQVRALPFRMGMRARRWYRALPWARPRPFVALVEAMAGAVRKRRHTVERALERADTGAITAMARRHACSAMLVESVSALHCHTVAALGVQRSLQEVGRNVALHAMAVRAQLSSVVALLTQAAIPFALLKGAARLYRDEADAALHSSGDLDILVPVDRLDAAIDLFRANGYAERANAMSQTNYREHHHHAAPLLPATSGCPIELHVALAPPGWFSIPLDWEALRPHCISVQGPAGPALVLDAARSALHYAVHAVGIHRLRDVVLLAKMFEALSAQERTWLRTTIAQERIETVRLGAAVVLAARLAGEPWPATGPQEEYLRWVMRREDMPMFFGSRSQLVEGWFASDRRHSPITARLLNPRSPLGPPTGKARSVPVAYVGRTLAGVCAFAYAIAMRPLQ